MADDDPFAAIAKPIDSSSDPFASIAQPVGDTAAPVQQATTFGQGMAEGGNDLLQGVKNLPQALLHPVDTLSAMGAQQRSLADRASADWKAGHYGNAIWHGVDAMLPGLGPLDAQLTDEYQSGTPGAKSAAMGRTLVNALPTALAEGARPVLTKVLPKLGATMNNTAIAADNSYGANAGRGMYNAGIVGTNARGLLRKVGAAAGQASKLHNADLAQYGADQTLNLDPAINGPFDATAAAKTDPVTGAVAPAQLTRLRRTQQILNSPQDPLTGKPLVTPPTPENLENWYPGQGRDLTAYSPLDANKLKSNIYGMTDYDNPSKSSLANNALKQAAHNIKQQIDTAVPQSLASGQNLHDLMSAADALKGGSGVDLSKGGLINAGVKLGLTGGAQSLRAGAGLINSTGARALSRLAPAMSPRTDLVPEAVDPQEGLAEPAEQPASGQEQPVDQGSQGEGQQDTQSDLEDENHSQSSIAPAPLQPAAPLGTPAPQNGTEQVPAMQKNTPISFGGKTGKVVYLHPELGIARIKFDDGSQTRTVRTTALKVLPHTIVTSHVRRLSS